MLKPLHLSAFILPLILACDSTSVDVPDKNERALPERRWAFIEQEGAVWLQNVPEFQKARITKDDMAEIAKINPRKIAFVYVVIDSDAKECFAQLARLDELVMDRTNFDDDAFMHLKNCKDLNFLNLIDTDVTDDTVNMMIANHPKAKVVYVNGTAVTLDGYRRLKAAFPKAHISWGPLVSERFREKSMDGEEDSEEKNEA
jgi:hypothetical protein